MNTLNEWNIFEYHLLLPWILSQKVTYEVRSFNWNTFEFFSIKADRTFENILKGLHLRITGKRWDTTESEKI